MCIVLHIWYPKTPGWNRLARSHFADLWQIVGSNAPLRGTDALVMGMSVQTAQTASLDHPDMSIPIPSMYGAPHTFSCFEDL